MKKYLQLMAAASAAREALNKYMTDTPPDKREAAKVTELRAACDDAESKFRTAVETMQDDNDGTTEKRALVERIELRNYMESALNGAKVTGAEAELNKELGLDDTGMVPWEAFEERANEVTVPDDIIDKPVQPLLNRIFERTRVGFLGIRMPTVAMGEPVYPVMTGGAGDGRDNDNAGTFGEGDKVANSEATFVGSNVGPKRISGRYSWRMEQTTRFPIEDTLRADLRTAMGELLDKQIINGQGGTGGGKASDFDGIIRDNNDAILGLDVEAAVDGQRTHAGDFRFSELSYDIHDDNKANLKAALESIVDYVDGKAASSTGDIRTLVGVETYRRLATLILDDTYMTAWAFLMREGAQLAVSSIIPAKANKYQQAIQNRRPGDMVAPIWRGVSMIRDPYSGAESATISLTAHMLANVHCVRTKEVNIGSSNVVGNANYIVKNYAEHWRKIGFKLDA